VTVITTGDDVARIRLEQNGPKRVFDYDKEEEEGGDGRDVEEEDEEGGGRTDLKVRMGEGEGFEGDTNKQGGLKRLHFFK
jgi:hypothetical protein